MNPLLKPFFFGKGVVIHDDFQEIQLLKSGDQNGVVIREAV